MTDGPWHRRHRVGVDVAAAVCFMLIDTGATLAGSSWWPARPGPLAWVMLGLQAATCLSLVFRRRAPLAVVAILAAFTLAGRPGSRRSFAAGRTSCSWTCACRAWTGSPPSSASGSSLTRP